MNRENDKDTRLSNDDKSALNDAIQKLLNRKQFLVSDSLTIDKVATWRYLLPTGFADAVDAINSFGDYIEPTNTVTFHLVVDESCNFAEVDAKTYYRVCFSENSDVFYGYKSVPTVHINNMIEAQSVYEWCLHCEETFRRTVIAERYADKIIEHATTAGQIKRMLPDLVRYLPHGFKARIEQAQRRSRVPAEWKRNHEHEQILLEELAAGTLLPEKKPAWGSYSTTYLAESNSTYARKLRLVNGRSVDEPYRDE